MKFVARANGKKGEIYLYEPIGQTWDGTGITATSFQKAMDELKSADHIDFYVNSPGGNVFDGIAIYNQVKRHKAAHKVMHIDGIAASIASIIVMAGTERRIASNGMMMIHDPSGVCMGTSQDMRKVADSLDQVRDTLVSTYVDNTGGDATKIRKWMDEETWMDADLALKLGFVTSKTEAKAVRAEFTMLKNFAKVPPELQRQASSIQAQLASLNMRTMQLRRGASPAK